MSFISQLRLHLFRCYEQAEMTGLPSGFLVLTGPNGAGKTNILEAVSMLTPGRGLRGARLDEMQKMSPVRPPSPEKTEGWSVAAIAEGAHGPARIGTGLDAETGKRLVRINGETAKSQSALAAYFSCVWLTPQMDRLFIDSAGSRRRFLDRMVFSFDPGHSGRVTRYENAMAQRAKLLREGRGDPAWLEALESQMAATGVAIAAARLDFIHRLQEAADRAAPLEENLFPHALLSVRGTVEELLDKVPALEVEDMFRYQLQQTRGQDAAAGGSATGTHRSDFSVTHGAKNMPADQCSTGEQKALLIGLIIAHGRLMAAERGAPPVLLLDEIAAHLDEGRRTALYDILQALGGQVWMTGTERSLFAGLEGRARFIDVRNAEIYAADATDAAAISMNMRCIGAG